MRTELHALQQLEDARKQFNRERERNRRELEQQASVIEKVKQELAAEREKNSCSTRYWVKWEFTCA